MGKVLVIAEKPSVAISIAKVLGADSTERGYMEGNGYIVSFCYGHLCEYATPEVYDESLRHWKREALPIIPNEWKISIGYDKKSQFDILKSLLHREDIDYVVNACDAGREGELIFYFVYEKADSILPVKRLWISSLEQTAIREGFENLKDAYEYRGLRDAAISRSKADWLVGINGTRLFSTLYGGTLLKVGRVQSPTLAMIVERDKRIRDFVPEPYYTIKLHTDRFEASTDKYACKKDAENDLNHVSGQDPVVSDIRSEDKKKTAPKLYDLTSLQRDANRMYGISAKDTLEALQELYEKKMVTYPRTDSRYLTDDMADTAEEVLDLIFIKMLSEDIKGFSHDIKKILNSKKVSDHHAIIPTAEMKKLDIERLPEKEKKIFHLVAFRLVEAVAPAYEYTATKVEISMGDIVFKTSGRTVTNIGFRRYEEILNHIFKRSRTEDEKEENPLPTLTKGQKIEDATLSIVEAMTKAPQRFTEDTLLKEMELAGSKETYDDAERKGIGTPATRAEIIEKLIMQRYVIREKKSLVSTEKGEKLISILPENLKSPLLTAEWENRLSQVAKNEADSSEFINDIEDMVRELIDTHKNPDKDKAELFLAPSLGTCPNCGNRIISGKYGPYCADKCGITVAKAYGKVLSDDEIRSILSGEKTLIRGIKSKKGSVYDAYLTMTGTEDYSYVTKDGEEKAGVKLTYDVEFPEYKRTKKRA